MNTYRVTFYSFYRLPSRKLDSRTIWVEANNDHHGVAEATMLAMGGTGNADAEQIGAWLRVGAIHSVHSTIETN